jgi:hypothetical protein
MLIFRNISEKCYNISQDVDKKIVDETNISLKCCNISEKYWKKPRKRKMVSSILKILQHLNHLSSEAIQEAPGGGGELLFRIFQKYMSL